jgi:hypothetical protein
MLTPEEKAVLDIMASVPDRPWPSGDLKRAVLARLPHLGEKTVRRLFAKLEGAALLEREGNARNTTWRLLARGPREAIRPSVDLSLALLKLRQLAKHHLPPGVIGDLRDYLEGANRVLGIPPPDSRIRNAQAWIGKTARLEPGYPVIAPEIDDDVFDTVCGALYRDESLHIVYRPGDAQDGLMREYVVLPYAIVEKGLFWYLVVRGRRSSGVQGDPFLLRVDRIASVELRGFDAKRDTAFELETFIRSEKTFDWFPQAPEPVVLRVRETLGIPSPFRTVRLAADQMITEEEGGFTLRATITPSVALRNLLLERSSTVELLKPERLRAELGALLATAAQRYAEKV